MIGGGKDQGRVCGLKCIGGISKVGWASLGCYMTVSEKLAPQPTDQDRHNQSDN